MLVKEGEFLQRRSYCLSHQREAVGQAVLQVDAKSYLFVKNTLVGLQ
jgi:hypothetical protein